MSSYQIESFYPFKIKPMWNYFIKEHYSFWAICGYLFFEFVKPQALFPIIDFLPWAQLLLMLALAGAVLDPTVKWVSSVTNIFIILFLFMILVSIAFARYPEVSKLYIMDFFG